MAYRMVALVAAHVYACVVSVDLFFSLLLLAWPLAMAR